MRSGDRRTSRTSSSGGFSQPAYCRGPTGCSDGIHFGRGCLIKRCHHRLGLGKAAAVIKAIKSDFETQNPDVEINLVEMGPWDLMDKLLVALSTGEDVPDVAEVVRRVFPPYAQSGQLLDLTDMAAAYKDGFTTGSVAEVSYDGKLYAMPTETSYSVFAYNKEIFAQYGIDPAQLQTWDDVKAAGEKLNADGIKIIYQIMPTGPSGSMLWNLFFISRGGNIFDENGKVIRDNQLASDTFRWYYDMKDVSWLSPYSAPTLYQAIKDGTLAAVATDSAALSSIKTQAPEMAGKWAFIPWPRWSQDDPKVLGRWGGSAFTIPAKTKHPEAAWKLVEYLTVTDEGITAMWETGSLLTSYQAAWDLPALTATDPFYSDMSFVDMLKDYEAAPPYYWVNWSQTQTILGTHIDEMFVGASTPEEAWAAAEAEIIAKTEK